MSHLANPREPKEGQAVKKKLALLPHSGLIAPAALTLSNFDTWADGRGNGGGCAADVAHPTIGLLGRMHRDGRNQVTFVYADRGIFGPEDMAAFIAASTKRGEPLPPGGAGLADLVDALIYEHETEVTVARTRQYWGIAVRERIQYRSVIHSTSNAVSDTVVYNSAIGVRELILSPVGRDRLIKRLSQRFPTPPNATSEWEMFNGRQWVPLHRSRPSIEERTARIQAIQAAHQPGNLYLNRVPVDDMYLSGPVSQAIPEIAGERGLYLFRGDRDLVGSGQRWCTCPIGPRARLVRIEQWTIEDGLVGAGNLHAKRSCRGLVTVD
jgi:hypothetical protein